MDAAGSDLGPAGPAARPTAVRHVVLAGMAGSVVVAYLSRAALAPAGELIKAELGLSNTAMGAVHGAWAAGYVGFQLPGGWLGDRWGRRIFLPLYGMIWALCTLATSAAGSFAALWWSRLVFGVAQAGLVPCLTRACVDWFPVERRGSLSAVIGAGMQAGAIAASGLSAIMLPWLGWRLTLQLFALASAAWAAGFWITFRDRPEQHDWVNAAERALIHGGKPEATPSNQRSRSQPGELAPVRMNQRANRRVDRLGVYRSQAFAMLNAQAFCRAFCYAFLISWFPSYLERAHRIQIASASVMTIMPLAGVAAGTIAGGALIDYVLKRTGSRWSSRSVVAAAALILGGLGPLAAIGVARPAVALMVLALGAAASGMAAPATWAATMDVGGKSATSVMAIANMSGNAGAFLCPVAVGAILDAFPERWALVLLMFALVSIAGGLCWLFLDPDRPDDSSIRVVDLSTADPHEPGELSGSAH
jgi:sugar phosphate permease